jgi:5,10-methylenetetrahydrofolate reductase
MMPIQNYASFRRLINLCKCPVPKEIIDDLDPIKVSSMVSLNKTMLIDPSCSRMTLPSSGMESPWLQR